MADNRFEFNPIITGLIVGSFLILQSYLTLNPNSLDLFQQGSLFIFAITIPALTSFLFILPLDLKQGFTAKRIIFFIIFFAIVILNLIGISLSFFHFSVLIGSLFILMGILFLIISFFIGDISKRYSSEPTRSESISTVPPAQQQAH